MADFFKSNPGGISTPLDIPFIASLILLILFLLSDLSLERISGGVKSPK
jgi:hypothetical protein